MAGKTIEDLKEMRTQLSDRLVREAYWAHGPDDEGRLAKVANLHIAIQALDSVIASGAEEPPYNPYLAIF